MLLDAMEKLKRNSEDNSWKNRRKKEATMHVGCYRIEKGFLPCIPENREREILISVFSETIKT